MKVLLVEDDVDLLDLTATALRQEGFGVSIARNGQQAVQRWQDDQPDVVVLDIGLPKLSGFEVCRQIRERSRTPVVFLSALHADDAVARGFDLGADDYVTKPFSVRLLAMRLRAICGRGVRSHDAKPPSKINFEDLHFDLDTRSVTHRGLKVQLTRIEARIMHLLLANAGRLVSSERLVQYVWGYEDGDMSLLKAHISNIRAKLNLPRRGARAIIAASGVGYQFNLTNDD